MARGSLPNVTAQVLEATRQLGSRGSRTDLGGNDPAGPMPHAAVSVLAGVPAWWAARAQAAGLTGDWLDVRRAVVGPHPDLPDGVESPVPLDAAPEHVGHLYVTSLPRGTRSRHGRHYTTPDLATCMWQMVRRALGSEPGPVPLTGLVRDPACGSGALLLPALREHLAATSDTQPELVLRALPELVEGTDLDPAAVWLTSVLLASECLPLLARIPVHRREPLPALARVADGLVMPQRPARVVTQNPPYGRVKLDPAERNRFVHLLRGHANLYGLFVGHHSEHLAADGVMVALVPTSFTTGAYFTALRGHLDRVAPLREVAFVSDRDGVFDGVLQETCLASFVRGRADRVDVGHVNGSYIHVAQVGPRHGDDPWLLPRRPEDADIARRAAALPLTLAGAGWAASTGPLVWNRRADDLYAHPGKGRVRVLWASDIDNGRIAAHPSRSQLRYVKLRGPRDDRTLCLDGPAILVQRTTAPEQAQRLVAAELTADVLASWGGRVVVENHVNVLRPSLGDAPALSRRLLARLLARPQLDRVVRCLSGSVALSAYELEALPLPDAETLSAWEPLDDAALSQAVEDTYGEA